MKVSAFTILEAIIGMLVSSVILMIILYLYQMVSQSFVTYQEENRQKGELLFLKRAMENDLKNCSYALASEQEEKSIQLIGDIEKMDYTVLPDRIVRIHPSRSDTFFIKCSSISFSYSNSTFRMLTGIQLDVELKNVTIPLLFSKRYSAIQLMKGEDKIRNANEY